MSARWTIRHADGDILVDGHLGDYPEPTRGDRQSFEWVVYPRPSASQSQATAYERLTAFAVDAGRFATVTTEQSTLRFDERLPPSARVSTLLVKIEPGADIEGAPTLWGLVDSIDDQTQRRGGRVRVDMNVLVLSDVGEHSDESSLRSDLGV